MLQGILFHLKVFMFYLSATFAIDIKQPLIVRKVNIEYLQYVIKSSRVIFRASVGGNNRHFIELFGGLESGTHSKIALIIIEVRDIHVRLLPLGKVLLIKHLNIVIVDILLIICRHHPYKLQISSFFPIA